MLPGGPKSFKVVNYMTGGSGPCEWPLKNLLKFSEAQASFHETGQAYRRCFSETAEYPSQGKVSGVSLGTEF